MALRDMRRIFAAPALLACLFCAPAGRAQVSVLTGQYDNARSGVNRQATKLNRSNVNNATFGKRFSRTVDGYIHPQPLYASNVMIPGSGEHNAVYVATMHNSIYAFDADS